MIDRIPLAPNALMYYIDPAAPVGKQVSIDTQDLIDLIQAAPAPTRTRILNAFRLHYGDAETQRLNAALNAVAKAENAAAAEVVRLKSQTTVAEINREAAAAEIERLQMERADLRSQLADARRQWIMFRDAVVGFGVGPDETDPAKIAQAAREAKRLASERWKTVIELRNKLSRAEAISAEAAAAAKHVETLRTIFFEMGFLVEK